MLGIADRQHGWRPESVQDAFMIHVRHAAAAIAAGLCETVLITMAKAAAPVSGAPVMSSRRRASRGNSSSPIGQWAADFVHDPGLALHEDLWALA
jgi:hypothetical protein